MGYDYVIRITVDSFDDITEEQLLKAYDKFLKYNEYNEATFFFGCDGHGGCQWLSCGDLKKYTKKLQEFTKDFPTKTFTFYNHFFDYCTFEKIVIKNNEIISFCCFGDFDTTSEEDILFSICECKNNGVIFLQENNIENIHLPTNIIFKNELSGLFSKIENSMSDENVTMYLKNLFKYTYTFLNGKIYGEDIEFTITKMKQIKI